MRKFIVPLALALVAGLTAQSADAALMSRIVNMNGVNVRTRPSTDARIIGHVNLGEHVYVVRHMGPWDEVLLWGRRVFVDHSFLSTKLPLQSRYHHYRPGKFERLVTARKDRRMVWLDFDSHLYHWSGYGPGKHGGYMSVSQAIRMGGRPDPHFK